MQISLPKYRLKDFLNNRWFYLLLLPGLTYFFIFRYIPMWGLRIAFMDYNMFNPSESTFIGMENFMRLFSRNTFVPVLWNTIRISLLRLFAGFPIPIILALMMNEMRSLMYKRTIQTVLYLPHFISWVIMAGLMINLFDPSGGVIAGIIRFFTGETPMVLTNRRMFVPMLVASGIYKEMGWGTIIYFAAISGIDSEQYEAATIDGASRLTQVFRITIPSIMPTIIILFILNCGGILNAGFEQVFMLYSPPVYEVADIIDTFVYRMGIIRNDYAFSTAAGFFKSVVAFILIVSVNQLARLTDNQGIF
ncbi:MAG: ABC transporter permease subunit [Treponema sp.]|nr:ABC transporter permease subunit [Treponema sp.]